MKWMILALRLGPQYVWTRRNEANSIAPQKRMLSSMTPTIVERTESFYDRWFPWRFDDYYFCAANDIECIRIQL
jgi:hypothetical protein